MTASLTDIDIDELLKDEIPCRWRKCGKPATHRLIPHGPDCFKDRCWFICAPCIVKAYATVDVIRQGLNIRCPECGRIFISSVDFLLFEPL